MLQKLDVEERIWQPDLAYLLSPAYYLNLLKRRLFYFAIPFFPIFVAGLFVAMLWPATYLSQGKILVQSQQIPIELVRPTVTTLASERIQVIEQRVMTRDNLLEIAKKFQLFPEQKNLMQPTQVVELMRNSSKIEPLILMGHTSAVNAIAFTVGFEYQDALIASKVANELVTRILNEDLRDRTSRATDTTKFLAREAQRLQNEGKAINAKIAEFKRTHPAAASEQTAAQLAQLRADLAQKRAVYSEKHPAVQVLKRQIEAFEKGNTLPDVAPDAQGGLDALEEQQSSIEKDLEVASQRLSAARLGETLERDQQSEKLEVIEQPTVPRDPIKPSRSKIVRVGLVLAVLAGCAAALAAELVDKTIRRPSDLFRVVESQLVISIPYISTKSELLRNYAKTRRLVGVAGVVLLSVVAILVYFAWPLDLFITRAQVGLFN
jgi:hypothetical protein